MRRIGWIAALVVLGALFLWRERVHAGNRAVQAEQARVAQAFADSVAGEAAERAQEAASAREAIRVASEARKAAERQMRATQTAMHNLLDSVEASAADTSVGRDSLARLVTALAIKIRADSASRAEEDSLADAERLKLGFAIAAQVRATDGWREAYERERAAHLATKRVSRRSFLSRVASTACTLALVGGGAELGSQVGSAAAGGAGGLLTSTVICR